MPHGTDKQLKLDHTICEFFTLQLDSHLMSVVFPSYFFPFGYFIDGNNNDTRTVTWQD
jgi:hypothetical protein